MVAVESEMFGLASISTVHTCIVHTYNGNTVFTHSWIASVADFLYDSDEPIFMGFGRDLSEIQAIY
jgi:hypothetical protein